MAITAEQIERLIEIVGEDEARPLVWRIITPDNQADLIMAIDELNFWLADDNDDENNWMEDAPDYDTEEDNDPIADSNGNTQYLFMVGNVEYVIWNGTNVLLNGVQVGVMHDDGAVEFF